MVFSLNVYKEVPVDPGWAVQGDTSIPDGAVTVRFTGTSTLLFSDGDTHWLVDGWFSRPAPLNFVMGEKFRGAGRLNHPSTSQ